ncbi:MAG: DUF2723 domain-containing protein [Anaerolineae bacterium]|nr:DUF2723 domain-containing protein [Anaerolineae bacterium]
MKRPPELLRRTLAGLAGAVWGLAIARLMAEAGFCTPLYSSHWAVAACAAVCALLCARLCRSALTACAGLLLLYVTGLVAGPLAGGVLLTGGALCALLVELEARNRCLVQEWVAPLVLGLVALGLYLRTLLPSVGQADTFEFQVVVPRLGVAHPPGYPVYILLGKLFTLLPVGNVAWRLNLASAVFAIATVLVLYRLVACLEWWAPAFIAALALAFSATFWSQAIVAEVYTLHTLFVVLGLRLLLFPCAYVSRRWKALALTLGLGLAHHLTMALLLPAVMVALAWERPRLRARDWLGMGGLFLLGLSCYLFIPLRWPALNDGHWMTPGEFLSHITGGPFHGALQLDGWRHLARWEIVWRTLKEPFGEIGLLLAAAGLVSLALTRRWREATLTALTGAAFVFYGLSYNVPDVAVFLLPAHLLLALWLGVGVAFLSDLAFCFRAELGRCALIVVALLPLSRVWSNFAPVDRSRDREGYLWGRYVMSLPLEQHSAVLADMEKFAPLYYLQQIEGVRPDLDLVLLGSEELYYGELHRRLEAGQTVYLARYLPNLSGLYLRSLGPLVEVSRHAFGTPVTGEGTRFGTGMRLVNARLNEDKLGRPLYHLTLYWLAEERIGEDLVVRLRLVDDDGGVAWASDGERPIGGLYPTNAWPTGVVLSDYYTVGPPGWVPPGEYGLEVGLFPRFGDEGLQVEGDRSPWLRVGTVWVTRPSSPPPPLPYEVRYAFSSGIWLRGYHLAGAVPAGMPVAVELAWHIPDAAGGRGRTVRLSWVDAEGRERGSALFSLTAATTRSRYELAAPGIPGEYRLYVGLVGERGRCRWLAPPMSGCPLARIKVLPAQEGLANFAGLILLLEGRVGRTDARPGEMIPVTLRWRGMRAMSENYTLSVQLVGPDGRLHGQVDMWPLAGTLPTTRWRPGEVVHESWEVRLDPAAPPGDYQVQVVWYLLKTMQRLPLLDENGRQVGDAFTVGRFIVEK